MPLLQSGLCTPQLRGSTLRPRSKMNPQTSWVLQLPVSFLTPDLRRRETPNCFCPEQLPKTHPSCQILWLKNCPLAVWLSNLFPRLSAPDSAGGHHRTPA